MNTDEPSSPAPELTATETDEDVRQRGEVTASDTPTPDELWEQCADLALEPRILDRFVIDYERAGVVGEERAGKLVYLVVTSRLLEKPLAAIVKGPSSVGKSWITERVLDFFPPEAYCSLTAMSPKVLAYDTEPISHRTLYITEYAGLPREAEHFLRALISEGRIDYKVNEPRENGGWAVRNILREGPTGVIMTTTRIAVHPENETRLLSIPTNDSNEQTREVLQSIAAQSRDTVDFGPWHALQLHLAAENRDVAVPFAPILASMIPPVAIRLRRDFGQMRNLIRAHALLHCASRKEDSEGRILATVGDYAVVRELVADVIGEAADCAVSPTIRETVEAVQALPGMPSVMQVANKLGINKSTASRRVMAAIKNTYLVDLEDKRGRPKRLQTADPLPEDQEILPTPEALAEAIDRCSVAGVSGGKGEERPQNEEDFNI